MPNCYHLRLRLTDAWRCDVCGAPVTIERKPVDDGCPLILTGGEDTENIDPASLMRDPRRPAGQTGEQIIAKAHRAVQEARQQARGRKGEKALRLTHRIPTEVWWGKRKESRDKHYWDDPANLKKYKAWEVES